MHTLQSVVSQGASLTSVPSGSSKIDPHTLEQIIEYDAWL